MYSFINDLSISPNAAAIQDNWNLIDTVMEISFQLRNFKIERLRVPLNFASLPIAGTSSIADYLANPEFDNEKKTLLYDFLDNRIEEPDTEIYNALGNAQIDKLINAYHQGESSDLLTEAYVMKCAALSFVTSHSYEVDFLDAELSILYDSHNFATRKISIENLYNVNSLDIHNAFLVEWKKKIAFAKTKWNPIDSAIWNDLTATTLIELDFPKSIEMKADKKEELRRVGSIVAEMNAWIFDETVTKRNKNAGQWRRIFRSDSGSKTAFLSIDFENPYGGFEVHNHKGTHQGQVDFLGHYNKEADTTGHHDINT